MLISFEDSYRLDDYRVRKRSIESVLKGMEYTYNQKIQYGGSEEWISKIFRVTPNVIQHEFGFDPSAEFDCGMAEVFKFCLENRYQNCKHFPDRIHINRAQGTELNRFVAESLYSSSFSIIGEGDFSYLLTPSCIADILGKSTRTIQRILHERQMPCFRIAGQYRVSWFGLLIYLAFSASSVDLWEFMNHVNFLYYSPPTFLPVIIPE